MLKPLTNCRSSQLLQKQVGQVRLAGKICAFQSVDGPIEVKETYTRGIEIPVAGELRVSVHEEQRKPLVTVNAAIGPDVGSRRIDWDRTAFARKTFPKHLFGWINNLTLASRL